MFFEKICLTACILFFVLSCNKVDVAGAAGPQGAQGAQGPAGTSPESKSDIQGKVALFDTEGKTIVDNSGVTVSLENTTPGLLATSASDGSFDIPSVMSGRYNISIVKSGYGKMRFLNFVHPGNGSATQAGILETGAVMPAQFDIKRFIVDVVYYGATPYLNFTCTLSHPQQISHPVVFYFYDGPDVYHSSTSYALRTGCQQNDDSTLVFTFFDFSLLASQTDKWNSIDSLHISAGLDNSKSFFYIDENGNQIFPCVGNLSNEVHVKNAVKTQ